MKLAVKIVALGVGACLVTAVVGISAVFKVFVDAVDGPNREPDWPA